MVAMATNCALLGLVSQEDDSKYRYFGPHGCVEAVADGQFAVYLGGSLVGMFTQREPAERDALIVVAMQEPRSRARPVAAAFRVSAETVARAQARAKRGGLAAVTQRRRRGAPLKRTPALRRKAFRLFDGGQKVAAAHRVLSPRVSAETVRKLYHEWEAERAGGAASSEPPVASEQVVLSGLGEAANDTTNSATSVERSAALDTTVAKPNEEPSAAEAAAERSREEMPLDEVVEPRRGEMVQHVGSWLMLAMLHWLGVYRLAKEGCGSAVSPVALRMALDAVAIALTLKERCVEGIRRLATPSVGTLLRSKGAISASWARRVLGRFAAKGSSVLQFGLVGRLLGRNQQAECVWLYVDNHMRRYEGRHVVRKGWRMQDKRALPGTSDYYVHDEEGRPLFRIDDPTHDSLTQWLQPIASFVRSVLGDAKPVCLCFDRGGAFPEQMAALRNDGTGFITYERAPYVRLTLTAFEHELTLVRESKPREPVRVRYTEQRQKNLGKGRGRVRRISLLMPDGAQINLLTANCTAPAEELIRRQLSRWGCQENQFKHEVERWGINQLDGRTVTPYPADATIPNPGRRRIDRNLRIARAHEGTLRSKLARLEADHPKRAELGQELECTLVLQQDLEALRPSMPVHAPVQDTEVAGQLVYHRGEYKRVIDALRIGLANSESELAARLAPHLDRPREAKKLLASLFAAPGLVQLTRQAVTVSLAPAGNAAELRAFAALLQEMTALKLTLPGDPSRRSLRLRLQT